MMTNNFPKWKGAAAAVAAISLTALSCAHAQLIYSTNFNATDENGSTYDSTSTLSDQNGWITNDPTVSGAGTPVNPYVGQSDSVGPENGYTNPAAPGPGNFDYAGSLGGLSQPNGYPGRSTVYLGHAVNTFGKTAFTFNVDFGIARSTGGTVGTGGASDRFGFTFRNGSVNLFSVLFTPNSPLNATSYTATANGSGAPVTISSAVGSDYDATHPGQVPFHLSLSVNQATGQFFATIIRNGDGASLSTGPIAYTTGGLSVGEIDATWIISNPSPDGTRQVNAGTNDLIFDNFSVNQVPEPSTCAFLGLGLLGAVGAYRRRRSA